MVPYTHERFEGYRDWMGRPLEGRTLTPRQVRDFLTRKIEEIHRIGHGSFFDVSPGDIPNYELIHVVGENQEAEVRTTRVGSDGSYKVAGKMDRVVLQSVCLELMYNYGLNESGSRLTYDAEVSPHSSGLRREVVLFPSSNFPVAFEREVDSVEVESERRVIDVRWKVLDPRFIYPSNPFRRPSRDLSTSV